MFIQLENGSIFFLNLFPIKQDFVEVTQKIGTLLSEWYEAASGEVQPGQQGKVLY